MKSGTRAADGVSSARADMLVLILAAGASVLVLFLGWEAIEFRFATNDAVAHRLHYARGISASLMAALVVGILMYRQQRRQQAVLETEVSRHTRELAETHRLLQLVTPFLSFQQLGR